MPGKSWLKWNGFSFFHLVHCSTQPEMSSGFSTILFSSASAYFTSLHTGMWAGLFLFSSEASMSTWTILPCLAELFDLAGDAVVEPHAQRDQQIGLFHGVVRVDRCRACRACRGDADAPAGKRAEAHHGHGHGDAGLLGQRAQLFAGLAADDAAAGVDHRPLGELDRRGDLLDLLRPGLADSLA